MLNADRGLPRFPNSPYDVPNDLETINLESNECHHKPLAEALEDLLEALKRDGRVDRACAEYKTLVKRWELLNDDAQRLHDKRGSKWLFLKLREAFGTVKHKVYPDSNLSEDEPTQTFAGYSCALCGALEENLVDVEKGYSSQDEESNDDISEENPRCPLCKTSHRDAGLPPFDKRTLREKEKAASLAKKSAASNEGEEDNNNEDNDNGEESGEDDTRSEPAKRKRSTVSREKSDNARFRASSAPEASVKPAVGGKKDAKDLEKSASSLEEYLRKAGASTQGFHDNLK